jgi:hypothetical protein
MATTRSVLHLGARILVNSEGHLDLRNANIISETKNLGTLSQIVDKIDFIKDNTDKTALDSLSELVAKAENISELATDSYAVMPHSPYLNADASAALPKSVEENLHQGDGLFSSYDGWLFKNKVQGAKINWYLPNIANLKVKDIRRLYMNLLLLKDTTNGNLPWITVYTKDKNDGTDKASWYSSRMNYLCSTALTAGHYRMQVELNSNSPVLPHDNMHKIALLTEGANTLKSESFSEEDEILYIAISSNSGSATDSVGFIVSSFLLQTHKGIKHSTFTNSVVEEFYLRNKVDQLFKYFFRKSVYEQFAPTPQEEDSK